MKNGSAILRDVFTIRDPILWCGKWSPGDPFPYEVSVSRHIGEVNEGQFAAGLFSFSFFFFF